MGFWVRSQRAPPTKKTRPRFFFFMAGARRRHVLQTCKTAESGSRNFASDGEQNIRDHIKKFMNFTFPTQSHQEAFEATVEHFKKKEGVLAITLVGSILRS